MRQEKKTGFRKGSAFLSMLHCVYVIVLLFGLYRTSRHAFAELEDLVWYFSLVFFIQAVLCVWTLIHIVAVLSNRESDGYSVFLAVLEGMFLLCCFPTLCAFLGNLLKGPVEIAILLTNYYIISTLFISVGICLVLSALLLRKKEETEIDKTN